MNQELFKPKDRFKVISIMLIDVRNIITSKDNKFNRVETNRNLLFIIDMIRKCNLDIVIFIGKNSELFKKCDNGFLSFTEKELIVWVNLTIEVKPIIEDGYISFNDYKLVCVNMDYLKNVYRWKKWNEENYTIIGKINWNDKRNYKLKKFKNVKWNFGWNDKTIGLCGKCLKIDKFKAFDNNDILIIKLRRKIKCNLGVRLLRVDFINTKKSVNCLLNGKLPNKDYRKFVRKLDYKPIQSEFIINLFILNRLLFNDIKTVFNKFNALWTGSRKEPFLGKVIPKDIVEDYKILLKHKENKVYKKVILPIYVNRCLINDKTFKEWCNNPNKNDANFKDLWKRLFSNSYATNIDMYQIKDIVKAIKEWLLNLWNKFKEEKDYEYINKLQNVLTKLINLYNKDDINKWNIALTFFLMKNPELKSVNHVRMIMLTPTILKVFETLIYPEVSNFISDVFKYKTYQCGAINNGSTVQAVLRLRDKASFLKADGILFLDISKGYESVDLAKLETAIKNLTVGNGRIRWFLIAWVIMVYNMDLSISGVIIKRTQGIPMGLMLSPLMFIVYLDDALKYVDKSFITVYIDDINVLLFREFNACFVNSIEYVKCLVAALKRYNLYLNEKKIVLISDNEDMKKEWNIEFPNFKQYLGGKFLGRDLLFANGNLISNDTPLFMELDPRKLKIIPAGTPLFIKKLIFNGALDGKVRYCGNVWYFVRDDMKCRIFERAYNFFRSSFEDFERIQVVLLVVNYFRLFIDVNVVKEWKEKDTKNLNEKTFDINIWNNRLEYVADQCAISYFDDYQGLDEEYKSNLCKGDIDIWGDYWFRWKIITKNIWRKFILSTFKFYNKNTCIVDIYTRQEAFKLWFIENKIINKFAVLIDMIFLVIKDNWIWSILDDLERKIRKTLLGEPWDQEPYGYDGEEYNEDERKELAVTLANTISWIWIRINNRKAFKSKYWIRNVKQYTEEKIKKERVKLVLRKSKEVLIVLDSIYKSSIIKDYNDYASIMLFNIYMIEQSSLINKHLDVLNMFEFNESRDIDNYGVINMNSLIDIYKTW